MKEKNFFLVVGENAFSKEKFEIPSRVHAPIYTWIWNGPVSRAETDRQLDEMDRLGIKVIYILPEPKSFRPNAIPTRMEPDYLTQSYFTEYRYAVERAKEKGMQLWLYNEGGWPSGGACGKVLHNHPEYGRKSLDVREKSFSGGEVYRMSEDTVAGFLENGSQIQNGYLFEMQHTVMEYYIHYSCFERPGIPDFPDLTRKEATQAFLEETHEAYKPYLQEFFGDVLTAVFTDEPTAPRPIPFREEIEEEFMKQKGYSIRPFLQELSGNVKVTEQGAEARIAWFDICSRLFCDNYLLREKEWSNKHGMMFLGHMDIDHTAIGCMQGGNFHLLRALRCLDVPGIDVIWRQIFPTAGANNGMFPRYASSAATQIGSRHAMTESFGVYGAGVTFDQMRYVLNYQAVRGINIYNFFGVPYCREGFQMTGEMPYFTEKHACYRDLAAFNQFAERLSYLVSLGENVAEVALYMPIFDLWAGQNSEECAEAFEKAGNELEEARIPFDLLDDDVLAEADAFALSRGEIVKGKGRYTVVVIPPCKFMPGETEKVLLRFMAGGGQVYMISGGEMPRLPRAQIVENVKGIFETPVIITGDTQKLRLAIRQAENGRMYLLYNEENREKTIVVHRKEDVYLLKPESGSILRPMREKDAVTLNLQSGEMAFLWQGDVPDSEEIFAYAEETCLDGAYTFRRNSRFVIDHMQFVLEEINEEERSIALGDWSEVVGRSFSGSGTYKTSFRAPKKEGRICIDLGEVRYTCELFINGKSQGVRVMSPYLYEIRAETLQMENTLEIRVSNTPANEYFYTRSFQKWSDWQLTPYHSLEQEFHKDSLFGGLYGPVKLKF